MAVDMKDVCCIARSPSIHDVEGILLHPARHNGGHAGSCLDDGMQPVLSVANASLRIELDGFTGEPPFTALDRRGHRIDAAPRDFAIGATAIQPFLGQLWGDRHDFQSQARLIGHCSQVSRVGGRLGWDPRRRCGCCSCSAWHLVGFLQLERSSVRSLRAILSSKNSCQPQV
jgi:hypothetical protein